MSEEQKLPNDPKVRVPGKYTGSGGVPDKGLIIVALAVAVVLLLFPLWYNPVMGSGPAPEPLLSPLAKKAGKCIEDTHYMRSLHMDMLNTWRDKVVREGYRVYKSSDGKLHKMSLTDGCLGCHNNKAEFCDKCHDYSAVAPYCWDCHIDNP